MHAPYHIPANFIANFVDCAWKNLYIHYGIICILLKLHFTYFEHPGTNVTLIPSGAFTCNVMLVVISYK